MTKEQERSVEMRNTEERLHDLIDDIRQNKIKACELISEEGKYNLADDIETVLSMLKEKDKEIKKKDKIIDLMAEQIKIPEPTMKIESFDIKPETKFGMRYLNKEEIKQYFEKLAERKSKNEN